MFRLKDSLHSLVLTGVSGNAAALIAGVTLHSALNIAFQGRTDVIKNISEEEKMRRKDKVMLRGRDQLSWRSDTGVRR